MNIKCKPHYDELKNIKDDFAFYLSDLINNFKDKNSILIIIDYINGLTQTSEFANWYKSFADALFTSVDNAPSGMTHFKISTTFSEIYFISCNKMNKIETQ